MLRPISKATKIAYKVLGVPAPLRKHKESPKKKYIDKRLVWDETMKVR
jgi:hypothetical protein